MKTRFRQEFILVFVTAVTGIFILAMSWSEFKAVAKEHASVMMFVMGIMLLFMALGNISAILRKRSWLKQMETLKGQPDPENRQE